MTTVSGAERDQTAYRADIDGLRAVAILAVLAYHAAPGIVRGGFFGVDVFFVISGYLISGLVVSECARGSFSYRNFFARRIRRIVPALSLVLFSVIVLGWALLLPGEYALLGRHVAAGSAFISNFVLWQEVGYFDVGSEQKPLLHLWSLGIEEQFYLVFPVLLVLALRLTRNPVRPIIALAVASFVACSLLAATSPSAAFYLPIARFWELLLGSTLAVAEYQRRQRTQLSPPERPSSNDARTRAIVSAIGLIAIAAVVTSYRPGSIPPALAAVIPAVGTLLVISSGSGSWPNRRLLALRPIVYVGLMSYSLYLWHWPLLAFVRILDFEDAAIDRGLRLGALILAAVAAHLTYRFVERPSMRRPPTAALVIPAICALTMVGASGLIVDGRHGFPDRTYGSEDPFSWPGSLRFSEHCLTTHRFPAALRDEAFCVEAGPQSTGRVLVIGDSHANALWPGIAASAGARGAAMLGGSACMFVRDVRYWRADHPELRNACPALMSAAYRGITRATDTVVLTARMAAYSTLSRYGAPESQRAALLAQGTSGEFPDAASLFEESVERELRYLLDRVKHVILVLQVPELGFTPRRCIRVRPIDAVLELRPTCHVDRAEVVRRQSVYREAVSRIVARIANPRLEILDPMDALCDSQRCFAVRDGVLLYRDDHHLSRQGARFVWSHLADGSAADAMTRVRRPAGD